MSHKQIFLLRIRLSRLLHYVVATVASHGIVAIQSLNLPQGVFRGSPLNLPEGQKDTQSRKWQLTINNPREKGFIHSVINVIMRDNFKSVIYYCMADEIGQNGTYHTHLFLCGRSGIRFSTLRNKFPGAHFEMCNGTAQENMEYVSKTGKWQNHEKSETRVDGTFEEHGEMPIERKWRNGKGWVK